MSGWKSEMERQSRVLVLNLKGPKLKVYQLNIYYYVYPQLKTVKLKTNAFSSITFHLVLLCIYLELERETQMGISIFHDKIHLNSQLDVLFRPVINLN